jgi:shikimate dehydrogenase
MSSGPIKRPDPGQENAPLAAELGRHRGEIDAIDAEILRLVNRRLAAAARIGEVKKKLTTAVLDTGREVAVFRRLAELNRGRLLPTSSLLRLYAEVVGAARRIQDRPIPDAAPAAPPAIFAVFGDPIGHSLSPAMHNFAFAASRFRGVYLAVQTRDIGRAVRGMKDLGLRGASVTLPHKETVMAHLDEIDETARAVKAVNTLVNDGGRIKGFNSDGAGAVKALMEKTPVSGKRVAVLGAGGAARAVAFGVASAGGCVTVLNRSRARGEALAADLGTGFRPLEEFDGGEYEVLVNTTPVGMWPMADATPVPAESLAPGLTVMDIVYNPLKTRLLREAEAAGCAVIDGLAMFVTQGAMQFTWWTGIEAPVAMMRLAVEAELGRA